ncbi:MAG: PD-(D/E)XK nuclease family protein, partial [Gammaproteobacteria bacterium]|nr:PD-(D/E)XK nuclease family protein [Gammaproteobacteria bacterium]
RAEIRSWVESSLPERIDAAVQKAFWRQERDADLTLRQLLQLERVRVTALLRTVVAQDLTREEFSIADVERVIDAEINGVRLRLRIDRIDRQGSGEVIILDYKTGMRKRILDGDGKPRDLQLVVYARALCEPIAGLGLINVDSREVTMDIVGRGFSPGLDWDHVLSEWQSQVDDAAGEIRQGDVRINTQQSVQAARPLSLLSRIRELHRDA